MKILTNDAETKAAGNVAGLPKRPSERSEEVVLKVAAELATKLRLGYSERDFPKPQTEQDLAKSLRRWSDGYELAKDLERSCRCSPDARMVEILDDAYWLLKQAHESAVREWVASSGIKPKFSVGDVIDWRGDDAEVIKIHEDDGRYLLFIKAHGHVREGLGTHGEIVNWERAEAAQVGIFGAST